MKIWNMLKGLRKLLKKIKFIYQPCRKVRINYIEKNKRKALQIIGAGMIKNGRKVLSEYDVLYRLYWELSEIIILFNGIMIWIMGFLLTIVLTGRVSRNI